MQTDLVLKTMKVIFYIVLIGLLIQTGALLLSLIVAFLTGPEAAEKIYMGMDKASLYGYNKFYYFYTGLLILALFTIKSWIAYLTIRMFDRIQLDHPFTHDAAEAISRISRAALAGGIIALLAEAYAKWVYKQLPDQLQDGFSLKYGAGEMLLLAGVVFIIAHVWQKGVSIQSENELTI